MRTDEARLGALELLDLLGRRHAELAHQAAQLALVQLLVAAHQRHQRALGLGDDDERLHEGARLDAEEGRHLVDRALAGRVHLDHVLADVLAADAHVRASSPLPGSGPATASSTLAP